MYLKDLWSKILSARMLHTMSSHFQEIDQTSECKRVSKPQNYSSNASTWLKLLSVEFRECTIKVLIFFQMDIWQVYFTDAFSFHPLFTSVWNDKCYLAEKVIWALFKILSAVNVVIKSAIVLYSPLKTTLWKRSITTTA